MGYGQIRYSVASLSTLAKATPGMDSLEVSGIPGPFSPLTLNRTRLFGLDDALALHAPLVGAASRPVGPGHVLGSTPVRFALGGCAPESLARRLKMVTLSFWTDHLSAQSMI